MRIITIILLTAVLLSAACSMSNVEPSVSKFRVVRATDTIPDHDDLGLPVFFFTQSGNVGAKVYVTTLGEQDPSKAKGWLISDQGHLTLCYSLPYYPMPPLTDGSAYAAVAYVSLLEYELHGLSALPKQATVSEKCPVGR